MPTECDMHVQPDLHMRARSMLLVSEQVLEAMDGHSPRAAVCLATASRLIHVAQDRIGCRIVSLPYERITSVEILRQRHTTTVQIMHRSGILVLNSADAARIRRFAATVRQRLREPRGNEQSGQRLTFRGRQSNLSLPAVHA